MPADQRRATLDVSLRPMEVAAVYVPPCGSLTWDGEVIDPPDADFGWFGELGRDAESGGCRVAWRATGQGLVHDRSPESRAAWDKAARMLRRAAREDSGPAVVYVVMEERAGRGQPAPAAVRVRLAAAPGGEPEAVM